MRRSVGEDVLTVWMPLGTAMNMFAADQVCADGELAQAGGVGSISQSRWACLDTTLRDDVYSAAHSAAHRGESVILCCDLSPSPSLSCFLKGITYRTEVLMYSYDQYVA